MIYFHEHLNESAIFEDLFPFNLRTIFHSLANRKTIVLVFW